MTHASEESLQLPHFLYKFEEVGSGDASDYIDLPKDVYNVSSCDDPCSYIFEDTEGKHSDKECLKSRAIITIINSCLQNITQIVGKWFSGKAVVYRSADKAESDENGYGGPQYLAAI